MLRKKIESNQTPTPRQTRIALVVEAAHGDLPDPS
jgi:hypothetical protein